jgi:cytochrome c-type biogenesis protein CcmF
MYEGRGNKYEFIEAELQLSKDGKAVATILPQRRLYDKFQRQRFSEATDRHPSLGTEIYVTLLGVNKGKAGSSHEC